jgi:hypothetical protein
MRFKQPSAFCGLCRDWNFYLRDFLDRMFLWRLNARCSHNFPRRRSTCCATKPVIHRRSI